AELNIDPGRRLSLRYVARSPGTRATIAGNAAVIATLARLESVEESASPSASGPAARAVASGVDLAVPLAGGIDIEAEKRRLPREIDKLSKESETHGAGAFRPRCR